MSEPRHRYRSTELGKEARCAKCGEYWPCDADFYYMQKGVPHPWCKACYKADPKIRAYRAIEAAQRRKGPPKPVPTFTTAHLTPGLLAPLGV